MAGAVGGQRWSLAGATALVTGGSKGIGHSIVEELAGFGARCTGAHVRPQHGGPGGVPPVVGLEGAQHHGLGLRRSRARRPGEAHGHGEGDLRRQARYHGKLKVKPCISSGSGDPIDQPQLGGEVSAPVQVNNAALLIIKPTAEYTAYHYSRIMATNLESCFHLCQLAHPLLIKASVASGGSVIDTSSIASFLAFPQETLYSVTKGGLNQLTRNLAAKWARDKIRVNCVAPGVIMTDMAKELPDW